jgi:IMP dehydrogenase
VIGGNIATGEAALALVEAGADAVKVGIGPGSICTTRIVAGVGVPQIIRHQRRGHRAEGHRCADDRRRRHPLLGRRRQGDRRRRHSVMMGSMFAGTEEAPGEVILYQGRSTRATAAWARWVPCSRAAADRYFQESTGNPNADKLVPEGIEGRVPYKGSVVAIIYQMCGGLRASMGYCGCADREMHTARSSSRSRPAGMRESHVHDVQITKEAPNYHID